MQLHDCIFIHECTLIHICYLNFRFHQEIIWNVHVMIVNISHILWEVCQIINMILDSPMFKSINHLNLAKRLLYLTASIKYEEIVDEKLFLIKETVR